MTRQEAVELLSNDAFKLCIVQLRDPLYEACYEALEMAIEALEQEETLQNLTEPNKSDLISRKDLINVIMRSSVYAWSAEEDKIAHEWVLNIINSLPAGME